MSIYIVPDIDKRIDPNRELNEIQKHKLDTINNNINKLVKETKYIIYTMKHLENIIYYFKNSYIKNYYKLGRLLQSSALLLLLTIITIYGSNISKKNCIESELSKIDSTSVNSVINIKMNDDSSLDYFVSSSYIKNNNNKFTEFKSTDWIYNDIDIGCIKYYIDGDKYLIDKNIRLSELLLSDTYNYINYTNSDNNAGKEFLLCSTKPLNLDTNGIEKKTLRFFEKSNPIMIKSYINSFNDSFLMLSETVGGGELNKRTLRNEIQQLENLAVISDKSNGYILRLNEIGDIKLQNIDKLCNNTKITYNKNDDILNIINNETLIEQIQISKINNERFGCYDSDLLRTNNDKVYLSKGFDDESSVNYKTFGLLTDNNLYCIRIHDEDVLKQFFDCIDINLDYIKINNIQSVIIKNI